MLKLVRMPRWLVSMPMSCSSGFDMREHHDVAHPVEEHERQHQRRLRLREERLVGRAGMRPLRRRRAASGAASPAGAAPAGAASPMRSIAAISSISTPAAPNPRPGAVIAGQHDQRRRPDQHRDPEAPRCACPRTAPARAGPAPAGRNRRRRCRAWRAGSASTASPTQNGRRLRLGATAAIANIPSPRITCITHSQVRFRPNRSTSGLHRNLRVTARCSRDVIADLRLRGADRGQELGRHLVQEAPGQPLAEVRRRRPEQVSSWTSASVGFATVQRWSSGRARRRQFFPGAGGAASRRGERWPAREPVDARRGCLVFDRNEIENAFQNQFCEGGRHRRPGAGRRPDVAERARADPRAARRGAARRAERAPTRPGACRADAPRRRPAATRRSRPPAPPAAPARAPARSWSCRPSATCRRRRCRARRRSRTRWAARPHQRHRRRRLRRADAERAVERRRRSSICGASSCSSATTSPTASASTRRSRSSTPSRRRTTPARSRSSRPTSTASSAAASTCAPASS